MTVRRHAASLKPGEFIRWSLGDLVKVTHVEDLGDGTTFLVLNRVLAGGEQGVTLRNDETVIVHVAGDPLSPAPKT
jgi:hypothetical protein